MAKKFKKVQYLLNINKKMINDIDKKISISK